MAGIFDTASKFIDMGRDVAVNALEKGKDAANGLAGSATELAAKGKIKAQLYDQGLEYDRLMRKLGTALYDQLKDDPTYADTNRSLFAEIDACVQRRQRLQDELAQVEANAAAARPVDVTPIQPSASSEQPAEPAAPAEPEAPEAADEEKAE